MKLYTLKVYPRGNGREIYRVIHILGKESLDVLCDIILESFRFTNEHLYEFSLVNRMYAEGNYQSNPQYPEDLSTKEKIDSLDLIKGQKFLFHYDFGDDWMFMINVQKIENTNENVNPFITKEKGFMQQYHDWDSE